MTTPIVLCDLDSTLADTRHRHHRSPHNDPEATWENYGALCADDTLIEGTAALLRLLHRNGHSIHILSGRGVNHQSATVTWLHTHRVPFDQIRLHCKGDLEDLVEYKVGYCRELQRKGRKVVLAIEDWPTICEAFEAQGVPAVCVNPRYRDDPMAYYESQQQAQRV